MKSMVCRFNQTGYCKFWERCHKIHENEMCREKNCERIGCIKRHPKNCKYFLLHLFCKFGMDCVFIHHRTGRSTEMDSFTEDVKTLKAEVNILKTAIKTFMSIKEEANISKDSIDVLKREIETLMESNQDNA